MALTLLSEHENVCDDVFTVEFSQTAIILWSNKKGANIFGNICVLRDFLHCSSILFFNIQPVTDFLTIENSSNFFVITIQN